MITCANGWGLLFPIAGKIKNDERSYKMNEKDKIKVVMLEPGKMARPLFVIAGERTLAVFQKSSLATM